MPPVRPGSSKGFLSVLSLILLRDLRMMETLWCISNHPELGNHSQVLRGSINITMKIYIRRKMFSSSNWNIIDILTRLFLELLDETKKGSFLALLDDYIYFLETLFRKKNRCGDWMFPFYFKWTALFSRFYQVKIIT